MITAVLRLCSALCSPRRDRSRSLSPELASWRGKSVDVRARLCGVPPASISPPPWPLSICPCFMLAVCGSVVQGSVGASPVYLETRARPSCTQLPMLVGEMRELAEAEVRLKLYVHRKPQCSHRAHIWHL